MKFKLHKEQWTWIVLAMEEINAINEEKLNIDFDWINRRDFLWYYLIQCSGF